MLLMGMSMAMGGWAAEDSSMLAQARPETLDRPSARQPELQQFLPEKPAEVFSLPPLRVEPLSPSPTGPGVEIRSFVIEGNTVFSNEELQAIAAPYARRIVTASELEDLRQKFTRAYVDRGYINSGAVIPQGAPKDGVLRLRIVEGQLDEVRLRGMERLREEYVRDRIMRGAAPLNVNALQESFRLLLADPLFTKMDARLLPGGEPGHAILDLDVTRARPYQFSLSANNYRPPSIGSEALGASGWVRNITGLGDLLDGNFHSSAKTGGGARYGLGWSVPVNTLGTQIQTRFDHGRSLVIEEPIRVVDIKSTLDSREIGISHPLIEDLRQKFSLGLTYVQRENRTTLLGQPFSFIPGEPTGVTKLDAWRFGQDYTQRMEQQVVALRSTFSFGRDNAEPVPGAVSAGPAPKYLVWLGQAQYARRVAETGGQVLARADYQWAHERLLPLERMAIGGVNTVRGYRENQLVRDNGYRAAIEYQHPLWARDERNTLTLGPFADYGAAWNIGETRDRIYSIGLGMHWRWQHLTVDLQVAKRQKPIPIPAQITLQDRGIHFELRYDAF